MTDLIARVDEAARDLLARVDAILLAAGVPAGHPAAALLPVAGALPGDVFAGLAEASPGALADTARTLRGLVRGYAVEHDRLTARPDWAGTTAEAVLSRAAALAARLDGPGDTLSGRLAVTAGRVDAVVRWLSASRDAMAATVARCLVSAEAVTVRTAPWPGRAGTAVPPGRSGTPALDGAGVAGTAALGGAAALGGLAALDGAGATGPAATVPRDCAEAAASIAAEVLRTAVRAHQEGCDLEAGWPGPLDPVGYRRTGPDLAPLDLVPPDRAAPPGRLDLPL